MQAPSPPSYETLLQNTDGSQSRVGVLSGRHHPQNQPDDLNPPFDVFLSQSNRDKARDNISAPTYWFLTEKLQIRTFLDLWDNDPGMTNEAMLFQAAHQCSYALVVLSPSFRRRPFCVKELNTFMKRWWEDNPRTSSAIRVIPILWNLTDTTGYCPALGELSWVSSSPGEGAATFLTETLWPDLARKVFKMQGHETYAASYFEDCLLEYIEKHLDEGDLPTNLRDFHRRKQQEAIAGTILSVERGNNDVEHEDGNPDFAATKETSKVLSIRRSNRKMMTLVAVGVALAIVLVAVLSSLFFLGNKSNGSSSSNNNCSGDDPPTSISANGNDLFIGGESTVTNNTFTQTNNGDVTASYKSCNNGNSS